MQESNEKELGKSTQESTQEQEMQRLRELLSQRELELLVSNPKEFNKFLLREIFQLAETQTSVMIGVLKLKEGLNQLGEALSGEESETESEPESEPEEDNDEVKEKKVKIEELQKEIAKQEEIIKKKGRK